MSNVINTNVSSLVAQASLGRTSRGLDTSLERLASGLRINSSRDDAAGLAIANRLSAQIGGLRVAVRNANDGISLAQTAEGALQESTNILLRIRDLAVQSINDSNDSTDRANIQKEVTQLVSEVDRIATTTKFSGQNLLDSTFTSKVFQVGAFSGEDISISVEGARTQDLGNYRLQGTDSSGTPSIAEASTGSNTTVATNGVNAFTLTLSPSGSGNSTGSINVSSGDSANAITSAINAVSSSTGISASAETKLTLASFSFGNGSLEGDLTFTLQGQGNATTITVDDANFTSSSDLTAVRDAINNSTNLTNLTAAFDNTNDTSTLTITSSDGYDIAIGDVTASTITDTADVTFTAQGAVGSAVTVSEALSSGDATDSVRVGGLVTLTSTDSFSIDRGASTDGSVFATNSSSGNNLAAVDVSTRTGAQSALDVIDSGLQIIDDVRATLGAVQNRLINTINNLTNVANNQEAARSRIVDADFAQETASLTRFQVLQQAGVSILAQANSRPQAVLSLLQ